MYWIRQISGRDWHWWHVLVLSLPHSRDLRGWRGRNSGGDCVASRIRPHTVLHIPVYVLKYTWYPSCCLPLSDRNVKYRTDTPVMNAFCFNTQFFIPLIFKMVSWNELALAPGPWLHISFCGTSYHHRAQIIVKTSFCSNLESRVFVLGTTHNNTQQLHLFLSQKPSVTRHQSPVTSTQRWPRRPSRFRSRPPPPPGPLFALRITGETKAHDSISILLHGLNYLQSPLSY